MGIVCVLVGLVIGGPTAWGLCYNHEMSPKEDYCDKMNMQYPCIISTTTAATPSPSSGNASIHCFFFAICLISLHRVDDLDAVDKLGIIIMAPPATGNTRTCSTTWRTGAERDDGVHGGDVAVDDSDGEEASIGTRCVCQQLEAHQEQHTRHEPPGFDATMSMLYDDQLCGKGLHRPHGCRLRALRRQLRLR